MACDPITFWIMWALREHTMWVIVLVFALVMLIWEIVKYIKENNAYQRDNMWQAFPFVMKDVLNIDFSHKKGIKIDDYKKACFDGITSDEFDYKAYNLIESSTKNGYNSQLGYVKSLNNLMDFKGWVAVQDNNYDGEDIKITNNKTFERAPVYLRNILLNSKENPKVSEALYNRLRLILKAYPNAIIRITKGKSYVLLPSYAPLRFPYKRLFKHNLKIDSEYIVKMMPLLECDIFSKDKK